MEYINVWLTDEELKRIADGELVHVERHCGCNNCSEGVEFVIQIQKHWS